MTRFCPTCGAVGEQPCTILSTDLNAHGERHSSRMAGDSPSDYAFGGDLWNCPNPQRLAVLYGEARGWTNVRPAISHLTSGMGLGVYYTDTDGTERREQIGAFALQDFAAGRTITGVRRNS